MKKTIITVVILSVIGKSFGLIRDILITNDIVFNELSDALYISIAIVLLAFSMFNTVIRTTFSPMFSLKHTDNRIGTLKELNSVSNFIITILSGVALIVFLFPEFFILLISPGISEVTRSYAIDFIKPLSFVILFYGLVSILNGYLQAIKIYKTSEIAGLFNNLFIIMVFISFYPIFGYISIVYGYILGSIIQFFIVIYIFKRNIRGFRWNIISFDIKPIKEFSSLSKYLLLGALISQLTVIADKFVASFLDTGSITALQYATTIKNLPIALVILVVTNVLFTNLSINYKNSKTKFELNIYKQINILLAFITPFIIFFYYNSKEIVAFLFLRGEFTQLGVLMTSNALIAYSFGLFFFIIKEVLSKAALAAKKTKITF